MWNHLFCVKMFQSRVKFLNEKLLFNDNVLSANLLECHQYYIVGVDVGLGHLSKQVEDLEFVRLAHSNFLLFLVNFNEIAFLKELKSLRKPINLHFVVKDMFLSKYLSKFCSGLIHILHFDWLLVVTSSKILDDVCVT
jgi:hypothetical protein